jgi:hypothetical protein
MVAFFPAALVLTPEPTGPPFADIPDPALACHFADGVVIR